MIGWLVVLGLALASDPPGLHEGPHLLELEQVTSTKIPIGRSWTTTRSLVLARVVRTADGWRVQDQETCAVSIRNRPALIKTHLPDPFVAALTHQPYELRLAELNGAWSMTADLGESVVGYDPEAGGVPETAESPSVVDSDRDGLPGATVEVSVFGFGTQQVWVAQRGRLELSGVLEATGEAVGSLRTPVLEQQVLGATHPLFARNPPELRVEEGRGRFRWRPLDATVGSCDAIPLPDDWEG